MDASWSFKQIGVRTQPLQVEHIPCNPVDQEPIRAYVAVPVTLERPRQGMIPVARLQGLPGHEEPDHDEVLTDVPLPPRRTLQVALELCRVPY